MTHLRTALLSLLALSLIAGCEASQSTAAVPAPEALAGAGTVPGIRLDFVEQEAGTDPYRSRYIVTERYLRIDDGQSGDDFILLDRRARTIYSANSADRTVLVIPWREREAQPPFKLREERRIEALEDAPAISGREAVHHVYLTNGKRCYDVIAVPGLLEDAVQALRDYRLVLASEHRRMLPLLPADTHEACDLSRHTFAPARHLGGGMPVQEWSQAGYRRRLIDFDAAFEADPALFVLPEGYRKYTMEVTENE